MDPMAILDEIQRLVPAYDVSRLNLLSGNEEHTQLVQITAAATHNHPELILPSNDTLFTSGTLGRFSHTLNSVMERRNAPTPKEVPAD
jgi:NADH-quinone oxidoreductase subunit G